MNHVQNLLVNPDSKPKNFWENTSDNSIIRTFLKRTDFDINDKFETLLAGKYIEEPIEENLWSLLYLTGYLTRLRPDEIPGLRRLPGQYAKKRSPRTGRTNTQKKWNAMDIRKLAGWRLHFSRRNVW